MKLFLKKILLFSTLLIAGAFSLDFCIGKGLKKTGGGEIQTWNDIFESKINSDIIISGNSRVYAHINPIILDTMLCVNSYNLGISGYPFNMQYVRFKLFEKYNKKPQLIIQGVDFNTLYRRTDAHNREQFLAYIHKYEYFLNKELNKTGFSFFELYLPALQYYKDLPSIYQGSVEFLNIKHIQRESRYKGYVGRDWIWDDSLLKEVLSKDSIVSKIDYEIVELFDSFLNYCKENSIEVILVFAPQYYKATEFTKNKNEVMDIYHSFAKKYNIPFLDYSTDSLCYDTAYFYNAMHLNKKGSELFSLKLANDIKYHGTTHRDTVVLDNSNISLTFMGVHEDK